MKLKQENIILNNLSPLEKNLSKLYRFNLIQPLKGFCRVIEEGSLSKAANKYGVTTGLLTKQIKVIELQLGINLFNRDKNCRIFPNEAGLKFYDKASKIINQLENLVIEFSKEMDDEESRILRVGTSPFILNKLIPFISKFEKDNRKAKIKLVIEEKEQMLDMLLDNKIDLVITSKECSENISKKIGFTELVDYTPYWVLWKGHPLENRKELTKNDIINSDFCFSDENVTMKSLRDFIDENKIKSSVCINKCGLETQKELIKNCMGIWLIFSIFLSEKDKEYFIFKNASNLFSGGKYGIYMNNVGKSVANKFTKSLQDNVKKYLNFDFLVN